MTKFTKFLVGAVAAFAIFGFAASASAAYMHTSLLKQGSKGTQVMSLQQTLNANGFVVSTTGAGSPGYETMTFGPATKSAVVKFQLSRGLAADGVVGFNTGTALAALTGGSVSYPAGCSSTSGFSTTTGMPCNSTANTSYPAGCTSNVGYSSTTGASCAGTVTLPAGCTSTAGYSTTTGQSCSTGGTNNSGGLSGTVGDITLSSYSSGLESQVGEGAKNIKVLGFEVDADAGSDVNLSTVKVSLQNIGTGSNRLNRYADTISIWNESGVKVGSAAASDFSESSNVYSRSIAINSVVRADQQARFFVSVDAVANIDSADYSADNWVATLDSVRFSDASGAILTENSSVSRSFNFTSLANASDLELKVNLSSSNLKAATVKTSTTSTTNNVELLKFTLRAQGGMMNVDELPIMLTTSGTDLSKVTGNVTLKIDGSTYSESVSWTGNSTSIIFNDLNINLDAEETVTGTVSADINSFGVSTPNFAQGTTLMAQVGALSSFDVEDRNGDPVLSSNGDITGSAVGELMTFRSTGVNTVMGNATITRTTDQNGNITQATYSIPVSVTSFGNTLYVGQSAQLAASVSGTNAFNVVYENSTTPSAESVGGTSSVTLASNNASVEGAGFRLDDGQTKNFTITVNLIDPAAAGSYRVRLDNIQTFTNAALTTGAATSPLLPVESYRTDYQLINS